MSQAPYLSTSEFFPEDPSQLLIQLTANHTNIASSLNIREIAQYEDGVAVQTGQQFSVPNSQNKNFSFRNVYYFGAIAAGVVLTIPNNIVGVIQFTRMYGTCITAATDFRPLPFVSITALTDQIAIRADATNLYIGVGTTSPNVVSGIAVLEYLLT